MTIPDGGNGTVVTFYAYSGGVGRTMALANVAWILAAAGRRVLVADWEIESPGLHRFFAPFVPGPDGAAPDGGLSAGATPVERGDHLGDRGGVIDLIRGHEQEVLARRAGRSVAARPSIMGDAVIPVGWDFGGGRLDLLGAGRQNDDYTDGLSGLYWRRFHQELEGGAFLAALRREMKRDYDYTLIDSRSGSSGVVDICTLDLPDVLVGCFTLGTRAIDGAARNVGRVQRRARRNGRLRILPVPMRVDDTDKDRAEVGRAIARSRFAGLPAAMTDAERDGYWARVEVPYRHYYAHEEILAVFGDDPAAPGLLPAYEALTGHLTGGAVTTLTPMDEDLRRAQRARLERKRP